MLEIGHLLNRNPRQLSGGSSRWPGAPCYQSPNFEPFSALDQELKGRLLTRLRQHISDTSMAVLLSTHDAEVVEQLCSTTVDIASGTFTTKNKGDPTGSPFCGSLIVNLILPQPCTILRFADFLAGGDAELNEQVSCVWTNCARFAAAAVATTARLVPFPSVVVYRHVHIGDFLDGCRCTTTGTRLNMAEAAFTTHIQQGDLSS